MRSFLHHANQGGGSGVGGNGGVDGWGRKGSGGRGDVGGWGWGWLGFEGTTGPS